MFEALESRRLMAVTAYVDSHSNLYVRGDPGSNTIIITRPAGDRYYVQVSATAGAPLLPFFSAPVAGIVAIAVEAGDGNDFIKVGKEILLPTFLGGEEGNDTIYGGGSYNRIYGGLGDDVLYGGPLVDTVAGGEGNDVMYGGWGGDFMDGGDGNDVLHGEDGSDWIIGRNGSDRLYGEAGNDRLDSKDGITGNDFLDGGAGTDTAIVDATPYLRPDHTWGWAPESMTLIETYSF